MLQEIGPEMRAAMAELTRDVMEAISSPRDVSPEARAARQRTTLWSIAALSPGDPLETMLAGQCVIFDHLLREGTREALRGQTPDLRLREIASLQGSARMFLAHLRKLDQIHARAEAEYNASTTRNAVAREAAAPPRPTPAPPTPAPPADAPDQTPCAARTAAPEPATINALPAEPPVNPAAPPAASAAIGTAIPPDSPPSASGLSSAPPPPSAPNPPSAVDFAGSRVTMTISEQTRDPAPPPTARIKELV